MAWKPQPALSTAARTSCILLCTVMLTCLGLCHNNVCFTAGIDAPDVREPPGKDLPPQSDTPRVPHRPEMPPVPRVPDTPEMPLPPTTPPDARTYGLCSVTSTSGGGSCCVGAVGHVL